LQYALNLGQEVTIKNDTDVKTGVFLTLDENGYLILKMKDKEERIIAGDLFI
jgi:biotin-(acetyl-CoA carboxylase) ligase